MRQINHLFTKIFTLNITLLAEYLQQEHTVRQVQNLALLVGFDGFTDSIYHVVKSRKNAQEFECMTKMHEFSDRIIDAHAKSTNIELVLKEERLGGNGPILANALNSFGSKVSLIGAIGYPEVEPLFAALKDACQECVSIAPSGKTDAIEFNDGKILLGKHSCILTIDEKTIVDGVGKNRLIKMLEHSSILASTNWTMLFGTTALWNMLDQEILPNLKKKPEWMFVDLADPAKRSASDLIEALQTLTKLQKHLKVVLGLNVAESERIAKALNTNPDAQSICQKLSIEQVVIHAIQEAESATLNRSAKIPGPYVKKPLISTGGGDNFNAGYLLGLGLHLDLEECLYLATRTSGFYVEFAKSPSLSELSAYLKR